MVIGIERIENARERIADSILLTPCLHSPAFSERCGAEIFFKYETLQRTGSFKVRGALNTLLRLSPEERARGVIAASAGNHAQGVAHAATAAGVRSVIVMPEITPLIKISRTRELGGEVVLSGTVYDEAYERALEIQKEEGLIFVHPFDDERVIAGQGTIGLEILEQVPDLEAVVVPIGGGGLISGIATAVKSAKPEVAVWGVQTEAAPAMVRSLEEGRVVRCDSARSIADGIAIKRPGEITFEHIKRHVDGIRLVSEEAIGAAIFALLETGKVLAEGGGAAGLAAALAGSIPEIAGKRTVIILCGANIDVNILERIIDRSLVRLHRLVRLRITLKDQPGALADLLEVVGEQEANVVRVHHNRVFSHSTFWEVEVELTLEVKHREHIDEILAALEGAGYARVVEVI